MRRSQRCVARLRRSAFTDAVGNFRRRSASTTTRACLLAHSRNAPSRGVARFLQKPWARPRQALDLRACDPGPRVRAIESHHRLGGRHECQSHDAFSRRCSRPGSRPVPSHNRPARARPAAARRARRRQPRARRASAPPRRQAPAPPAWTRAPARAPVPRNGNRHVEGQSRLVAATQRTALHREGVAGRHGRSGDEQARDGQGAERRRSRNSRSVWSTITRRRTPD